MQPTDQAYLERAQRYRNDEAVLSALTCKREAVYPDLEALLDLPHPEFD